MDKIEEVRVTIYLPSDVARKIKAAAYNSGLRTRDYITWLCEKDTSAARKGPVPVAQDALIEFFDELFAESRSWKNHDIYDEMRAAGFNPGNKTTLAKVRKRMGIICRPVHYDGGGVSHWVWEVKR